jgi:urease accessory protein
MRATAPLLRLLHLASPALPIGGFHFSQGLEYAVERSWVRDESSACDWIVGVAENVLARLDLPVLARLHVASTDCDRAAIAHWNALLIASRETMELRAEDRHMGASLVRVLAEHGLNASELGLTDVAYATAFAFACERWSVSSADTLAAYAWVWSENQVLAAVKLVPLGQTTGQRILHRLTSLLPQIVERAAAVADEDIGVAAVMSGFASALHEAQYTRLFRS